MALMLFQLSFKTLEQGKGIGRAAGKPGENFIVKQAAHFARRSLDHDIAQGYLAVAAQGDEITTPNGENSGAAKLLHEGTQQ